MDPVICTRRNGRCMKRKCDRRVGIRESRIQVCGGIFDKFEKRIQRGRRRISESSRVEEAGTGSKDNGEVCTGVQKSSKGKQV